MTLKESLAAIIETGYPAATIAKNIGRDPATLYRWLKQERNISEQVQNEIREELLRLKAEWDKIEIGD